MTFAWLDYSEQERRRALDMVDLFREQTTVDELGVGAIRDAFADLFFPGTSTIQTRARYFLFVPWLYFDLERQRVPSGSIAALARRAEIRLIDALVDSGERDGVIGIQARRALKRLPSNVYWLGLHTWGIRRFPASQPQYHRSLDLHYARQRAALRDQDGNPADGRVSVNWDPSAPWPPEEFPSRATFDLRAEEADYLRERIMGSCPGSLLAHLVDRGRPTSGIDFVWLHPQRSGFPSDVIEQLDHARLFSEGMHGAALLYNLMLAEARENHERIAFFTEWFAEWADVIRSSQGQLAKWDRTRFWRIASESGATVGARAKAFVEGWLDLVVGASNPNGLRSSASTRKLIYERERLLKRGRARLGNPRALELWGGDSGSTQIGYRWRGTEMILNDILRGLGRDA